MFGKIAFCLLLAIFHTSAEKFRFDNYTLYKVYTENEDQVKILQQLQDNDIRFDFWSDPTTLLDFVTIMSAPENKADLETFLSTKGLKAEVSMDDIQKAIDKENIMTYQRRDTRSMTWDAYYPLDDIYAWLDDLALTYPSIVSIIIGGESYEGRQIKGIRISHGSGKRAIFLEGGIHSREWISPSAVNFITNELLTSTDSETVSAVQEFDWYIFPVTNPDGYIWSFEEFRMWRKNRRPFGTNFGVDLNRNWNNNWLVAGSSIDPATDTYAGPGPFSEPETRSLSAFIRDIGPQIDLYLSFHSFSQLLLIPFGNSTEPYGNYHDATNITDELRYHDNNWWEVQGREEWRRGREAFAQQWDDLNIGRRAMGALSVRYGTEYITGNIAEAIYQATGGSVDWVKEHLQVPLVYCYELRDRGTSGFLLPTDQILPNNLETMDSVLDLIHQAKRFGYMNSAGSVQLSVAVMAVAGLVGLLRQ